MEQHLAEAHFVGIEEDIARYGRDRLLAKGEREAVRGVGGRPRMEHNREREQYADGCHYSVADRGTPGPAYGPLFAQLRQPASWKPTLRALFLPESPAA